jgi:hypothetical protein
VQIVDPTSAPPLLLDTLVLFDGSGNLVGDDLIFGDGFESGNADAWSSFVP